MKAYEIAYYPKNKSKPYYVVGISKSGEYNGKGTCFFYNGIKQWISNSKNNIPHGFSRFFFFNSKIWFFRNCKKGKGQGIRINFDK